MSATCNWMLWLLLVSVAACLVTLHGMGGQRGARPLRLHVLPTMGLRPGLRGVVPTQMPQRPALVLRTTLTAAPLVPLGALGDKVAVIFHHVSLYVASVGLGARHWGLLGGIVLLLALLAVQRLISRGRTQVKTLTVDRTTTDIKLLATQLVTLSAAVYTLSSTVGNISSNVNSLTSKTAHLTKEWLRQAVQTQCGAAYAKPYMVRSLWDLTQLAHLQGVTAERPDMAVFVHGMKQAAQDVLRAEVVHSFIRDVSQLLSIHAPDVLPRGFLQQDPATQLLAWRGPLAEAVQKRFPKGLLHHLGKKLPVFAKQFAIDSSKQRYQAPEADVETLCSAEGLGLALAVHAANSRAPAEVAAIPDKGPVAAAAKLHTRLRFDCCGRVLALPGRLLHIDVAQIEVKSTSSTLRNVREQLQVQLNTLAYLHGFLYPQAPAVLLMGRCFTAELDGPPVESTAAENMVFEVHVVPQ